MTGCAGPDQKVFFLRREFDHVYIIAWENRSILCLLALSVDWAREHCYRGENLGDGAEP